MPEVVSDLPPKPEPPKDYDCCGGGCADCELRLYLRRLADWQKLVALRDGPSTDCPYPGKD